MKNRLVKAGALLGIITAMVACSEKKEDAAAVVIDKEKIKQEIQAKENAFADLYNKGELKEIGYYANDAISYYPHREPLIGKQAIVNFLKEDMAVSTNKISFTTTEVFISNDAVQVVELGTFKVMDSASNVLNTGNYMTLFQKRDNNYEAVRDMSASDMPLK
ncbi:MAG TPA: DUF4440 domain-containing protein [Phnomibacter sp.]|nr:DUF4440 domain-containing protein [Phnomibacter sp.]